MPLITRRRRILGVFSGLLAVATTCSAQVQEMRVSGRIELVQDGPPGATTDASNVVVWLTSVSAGSRTDELLSRPGERFRLAQKNKSFDPHVLVVTVGTQVEFPNGDPFFHNVFSLFEGKRFDLGLYEAGTTRTMKFDRPGICYIFCNIHPEMSAVLVVLNTPYYAMTDRNGQIAIPNVPAGRYQLRVWDEALAPEDLKSLTREVTVSENNSSLGSLRLVRKNNLPLAHKNKYGRDYDPPTPSSPVYKKP